MTADAKAAAVAPVRFDAVLYPNRSLGAFGFHVLMLGIVLVSVAIGAGFMAVGAWPVTGFLGLDVLLLYFAFRWNRRESRRAEFIRLDQDGLCVRRIGPDGVAREWRVEPYWARVTIEEPARPDSQLVLSSRGERLVVGAFLTLAERQELAEALRAALQAHRAGAPSSAGAP